MASNVPKFASFRPKPKEQNETAKAVEKNDRPERSVKHDRHDRQDKHDKRRTREPSRDDRREGSRRHEKSREEEYRRERNKDRPRTGHREPLTVPDPSPREPATDYIVDRKGDRDIIKYGCLDRYRTPTYRRFGYGFILGLPTVYRIDRDESTDKGIVLAEPRTRRRDRLLASKHAARDVSRASRFIKHVENFEPDRDADFIELPRTRKRKRDSDPEEDGVDYRSIGRQKDSNALSDSDLESESDGEYTQPVSGITQTNSSLIQKTHDHPQDLQAWLDLIEHQEAMMTLGRVSFELSSNDRRNLADIRISTYEQALRKFGNDKNSQTKLYLGLMTEASRSWSEEKLRNKWSDILEKHPSTPELWIKYLDFVQSAFGSFKFETCQAACHKCLKALKTGAPAAPPEVYLHILIRLTSMIRSCGYQELSLAIWQSLLEFHLMRPETGSPGKTRDELVQEFEEFWESEVARIGEADAKGWSSFGPDHADPLAPVPILLKPVDKSKPILEDFQTRELDHMDQLRFSGRTLDDIGADDPFHMILFSDVEKYMHILPLDIPGTLLLEAFLCFSGMPPLPTLGAVRHPWWADSFLQAQNLRPGPAVPGSRSFAETLDELRTGLINVEFSLQTLVDHGFTALSSAQSSPSAAGIYFIRQVLRLVTVKPTYDEVIGEYLLAFEGRYFPGESFKTAKRLLKARPNSLRIYNACGLVESRTGNQTKADGVLSAALTMQPSTSPLTEPGSLQLFSSWIWEAFRREDQDDAIWRLVSPHGERSHNTQGRPDQTDILRTRNMLSLANERALLARDFPAAIVSTSLLAFLLYLTTDGDPGPALSTFAQTSDWFLTHALSASPAAELHAQSIAQFLAYHATHAPIVKPAFIRTKLEPLLAQFPSNTILLSLYAANEARFAIDDRVRSIVHQNALTGHGKQQSLATWFFAIHYEMHRGEVAGSTSSSIRSMFRRAEESDVGAHCPGVWTSHLLFEIAELEKERKRRPPNKRPRRDETKKSKHETRLEGCERRVKETFFAGVKNLPWCKVFMMMGFGGVVGEVLTEDEKRGVYNVMVEKEMRLHVDLDAGA